ncbi:unnamed protein product [Closterium sp. NIES-54]
MTIAPVPSCRNAHETLWAHASGDLPEPADPAPLADDPTPANSDRYAPERADVTAWKSHDAAACIALSSLLPESEETHFTQVRTASEFPTAIKARYATPTTISLGRLFLMFLFPDLASFERTADLIIDLRSLDSSYRAACTDAQLALLPPPIAITIYFIATSLPDRLASVPLSLATAASDVTAAAVTTSSRSRGRSGRRGGQGAGGGGGGDGGDMASGGGGSAGTGGATRTAAGDSPAAFGTPHAMYAVVDSSASDSVYSSVVSLGASLAEVPVASVGTCVDISLGASLAAPEDTSLSFTLDSGALHCFFRDRTTLTPIPTPVSVALADPTLGPVTARYTTTLPCPAVPSGSLTGFHVPSFSRNLVGVRPLVSQHVGVWIEPSGEIAVAVSALVPVSSPAAASCSCQSLARPTVLWHHRMGHPSISRLRAMSSRRLFLGLPRVLPSLPPSLAPSCSPCVAGRLRATPHSSSLRPATELFETLHLDPYAVWYAAHQLNLWPCVSRPEVSPTSLWTGSPGVASRFRVWGCLALVRDTSADKISPCAVPCVFPHFPEDSSDYTFCHPPLHRFFVSRDVRFDKSVPYYVRYPCQGLSVPPAPLFLTSAPPPAPPVQPPPPGPALFADPAGAGFRGEDSGVASSRGAGVGVESVPMRGPGFGGAGVGAEPVLQRFKLQHSTVQRTPIAVDHRLTGPFPDEPFEPSGPYVELVGCLMYLMSCTRPDLAFPLSILVRFVAPGRHRPVHWIAAVRVAKYLTTTSGVGLVLGGRQDVVLTGHSDSSYADDAETHRSTQGYCFSLGSGTVSWRSTRSSSVSTSTA